MLPVLFFLLYSHDPTYLCGKSKKMDRVNTFSFPNPTDSAVVFACASETNTDHTYIIPMQKDNMFYLEIGAAGIHTEKFAKDWFQGRVNISISSSGGDQSLQSLWRTLSSQQKRGVYANETFTSKNVIVDKNGYITPPQDRTKLFTYTYHEPWTMINYASVLGIGPIPKAPSTTHVKVRVQTSTTTKYAVVIGETESFGMSTLFRMTMYIISSWAYAYDMTCPLTYIFTTLVVVCVFVFGKTYYKETKAIDKFVRCLLIGLLEAFVVQWWVLFAVAVYGLQLHDDDKKYSMMCRHDATACDTTLPHVDSGGEGMSQFIAIALPLLIIAGVCADIGFRLDIYPNWGGIWKWEWSKNKSWGKYMLHKLFIIIVKYYALGSVLALLNPLVNFLSALYRCWVKTDTYNMFNYNRFEDINDFLADWNYKMPIYILFLVIYFFLFTFYNIVGFYLLGDVLLFAIVLDIISSWSSTVFGNTKARFHNSYELPKKQHKYLKF